MQNLSTKTVHSPRLSPRLLPRQWSGGSNAFTREPRSGLAAPVLLTRETSYAPAQNPGFQKPSPTGVLKSAVLKSSYENNEGALSGAERRSENPASLFSETVVFEVPETDDVTCCNARLKTRDEDLPEAEPGEWAGDGYCKRPVSSGRCRDHGGNGGRPATHGLYSGRRDELQERFEVAFGDDKLGSMRAEIASLKALLSEFWERIDEVDGETIDAATKLQSEIRKSLDTASKIEKRHAVTDEHLEAMTTGMAAIIDRYVPESKQADALDELERIAGSDEQRALESGR